MKMLKAGPRIAASLFSLLVCAFALGQAQQQTIKAKPYVPRKIVLSPEPVTKTEAGKVLSQATTAIVKVLPKLKSPSDKLAGSTPVTREEVIAQFDKIFQMTKPEFKFTPRKVSYDPSLLTIKNPATRSELQELISWGCVDKVGLLATSPKDTMSVTEFGDAVGFLLSRIADLTHMPDPRYSPDLEP